MRRRFLGGGLIAESGQRACHQEVFFECFPGETSAADPDLFPLLSRAVEKAWKPGKRNSEGSAVGRLDPHVVFVEGDVRRFNGRAGRNAGSFSSIWERSHVLRVRGVALCSG